MRYHENEEENEVTSYRPDDLVDGERQKEIAD